MGFGLLCTTGASLCLMFGYEKALLGGKDGTSSAFNAMDTAINTLKTKSTETFLYFFLQLIFFYVSSLLMMWILYSWIVAACVNVVMVAFLTLFFRNGIKLYLELSLHESEILESDVQA